MLPQASVAVQVRVKVVSVPTVSVLTKYVMVGLGSQTSVAVTVGFAEIESEEVSVVLLGTPLNTGGLVSLVLM